MALFEVKFKDKSLSISWPTMVAVFSLIIIIIASFSGSASSASEVKTKVDNIEKDVIGFEENFKNIEIRLDDHNEKLVKIDTKIDVLIQHDKQTEVE